MSDPVDVGATNSPEMSVAPALVEVVRELLAAENSRRGGEFIPGSLDDYVNKITRKAEFFLHHEKGVCDGFIAFYCNDPARKRAFVTLTLCAPSARGHKIADGLLAAAISVAKARNFEAFELEVDNDNHSAISLYRRHGFEVISDAGNRFVMANQLRVDGDR